MGSATRPLLRPPPRPLLAAEPAPPRPRPAAGGAGTGAGTSWFLELRRRPAWFGISLSKTQPKSLQNAPRERKRWGPYCISSNKGTITQTHSPPRTSVLLLDRELSSSKSVFRKCVQKVLELYSTPNIYTEIWRQCWERKSKAKGNTDLLHTSLSLGKTINPLIQPVYLRRIWHVSGQEHLKSTRT